MPRAEKTADRLVETAVRIVDEGGPEALTLAAVARALGIRTPSLYHHVEGLEGLRREVRRVGLERLGDDLQRASSGLAGRAALEGAGRAYLAFGRRHPGLYALTLADPTGDEGIRRAADRLLETILAVLRGYGLEGRDALHATRYLRSALHGFVALERAGGFAMPLERETSFAHLLEALDAGIERLAHAHHTQGRHRT